jgi:hypothetical protein
VVGNAILVNFSGGETSPKSRGRFDEPFYQSSARKILNWITDIKGQVRYRPSFLELAETRRGAVARGVAFQLTNSVGYFLEFTAGFMRVYKNEELLTKPVTTVVSITQAGPAILTVVDATDLANGDTIILSDVVGMREMNGRQLVLSAKSGVTFQLLDNVTGVAVDSSAFGAYNSGGSVGKVYEIASPYLAGEIKDLQWAADAPSGTMYLTHPKYAPRKLTVDSADNFTLGTYSRTSDPFTSNSTLTLVGVDRGTKTKIRFDDGSVILANTAYDFSGVVGTTELNGNTYYLKPFTTETTTYTKYGVRLTKTAGSHAVPDGGYIQFTDFTGVLAGQIVDKTLYVKNVATNVFELYEDPELTVPFVYSGSVDGSFTGYSGASIGHARYFVPTGGVFVTLTFSNAQQTPTELTWDVTAPPAHPSAYLQTVGGADIDSSGFTDYVSGGTATAAAECPIGVAFYEGRLVFGGTNQRPACLFMSRSPDSDGNQRYDDFTGGTNADHACFFQLAPVTGISDFISWVRGGPDHLFVGSFGGPFRVSGSGLDIPITPSSINVRQFDTAGCEETMPAGCQQIFFIQRGGTTLRSIKVLNPYLATFESADMCMNADQIPGESPLQRVVLQQGRPDILWVLRANGTLAGLSVHLTQAQAETITGWHRHRIGGNAAKVLDIAVTQRTSSIDRLWIVSERVVNGVTRRAVEIMADPVIFPDPEDFDTGNAAADRAAYLNALYALQGDARHLDAGLTYDGAARGVAAGATLTPGATTGAGVTFTASQSVFTADDVGSEIWNKPNRVTGLGAGRATITSVVSGTQVIADVTADFRSTAAIPAGDWYFAVDTLYGAWNMEGESVGVTADGAVAAEAGLSGEDGYPTITPVHGKVTLPYSAASVTVGFPYAGFVDSHNLEMGGRVGPAQDKPRTLAAMFIRFLNTLGVQFGTDRYRLARVEHRLPDAVTDRPAPVFSGIRRLPYEDLTSGLDDEQREKRVTIAQKLPLPAAVQFVDVRYETVDEG